MLVACAGVYFVYCLLNVLFKLLFQSVMIDRCGSLFTFFFSLQKGQSNAAFLQALHFA